MVGVDKKKLTDLFKKANEKVESQPANESSSEAKKPEIKKPAGQTKAKSSSMSDNLSKAGAEAKVDAFLQKREALFEAELKKQRELLHSKTHQDLINAAYKAADKLGIAPWVLLRAAGWGHFTDERGKKYDGPAIDEIEGLKPEQKAALKEALGIK